MPSSFQRRSGRMLRYRLTLALIAASRPLTVGELVSALGADGGPLPA